MDKVFCNISNLKDTLLPLKLNTLSLCFSYSIFSSLSLAQCLTPLLSGQLLEGRSWALLPLVCPAVSTAVPGQQVLKVELL